MVARPVTNTAIDWSAQDAQDTEPLPKTEGRPKPPGRFGGIAAKKAAPQRGVKSPGKPKVTEPPSKAGEFVEDITAFYAMLGMGIGVRDKYCGMAIVENSSKIAEEWDKLAQTNSAVRKALRSLTKATAVGTLVAAHVPIIMAVSAHHGPGFGPRPETEDTDMTEDMAS